ncbi:hypothetical protein QUF63_10495 [Anaerolineales bacterium HSG25]|nr:hypothetical protein [Anaerolineales bacterium HSG25]
MNNIILRAFLIVTVVLTCLQLNESQSPFAMAQSGTGIVRVDGASGADSASCGAVVSPCKTIQQAVDNATSGDEIRIAQGTYTGTGSAVVDISNTTAGQGKNLTLSGGYSAGNWNTADTDETKTMLDGQNSRRVIRILSVDTPQIILNGLTIQNGLVNETIPIPNTGEFSGGGLLCRNDNPNTPNFINLFINNVIFKNNKVAITSNTEKAVTGGGASFYFRCSATLEDVTFEGNSVQGGNAADNTRGSQALGGGFFISGGFTTEGQDGTKLTAKNVTFTNNSVTAGLGGTGVGNGLADALGGGAAIQLCRAELENITATGNTVVAGGGSQQGGAANGGGLFFELNTDTVTITGGMFKDNQVTGGASSAGTGGVGGGGAIMATDSTLSLNQLIMVNNTSSSGTGATNGPAGGGALYFTRIDPNYGGRDSKVTGTNLIMSNNTVTGGTNTYGGGGAVFSQDTTLTLNHVTMSGNTVLNTMQGAALVGLHNLETSVTNISYSIVSDHKGSDSYNNPRAPLIAQTTGDSLTLNYVLFFNNNKDNESGKDYASQPGSPAGSLTSNNELTGDPAFVSPNAPTYDYHIQSSSAAVNKASGSSTGTDIDSETRPNGSSADIGADEYYQASPDLSNSTKSSTPGGITQANNTINYNLTLKNTGKVAATDVTVSDPFPTLLEGITAAIVGNPTCSSGNCTVANNTVSWQGDIPVNGEVTIGYALALTIPIDFTTPTSIANSRLAITYDSGESIDIASSSGFVLNPLQIYLPLVVNN